MELVFCSALGRMTGSHLYRFFYLRPLISLIFYSATEVIADVFSRLLMRLRLRTTGNITSHFEFQMNPLSNGNSLLGIDKELSVPLHERTARITRITSFHCFCLTHHMHLHTMVARLERIVDNGSKEFPTTCTVRVSRGFLSKICRTILTRILNPKAGPTRFLFPFQVAIDDEFLSEGTASHQDTNHKSK